MSSWILSWQNGGEYWLPGMRDYENINAADEASQAQHRPNLRRRLPWLRDRAQTAIENRTAERHSGELAGKCNQDAIRQGMQRDHRKDAKRQSSDDRSARICIHNCCLTASRLISWPFWIPDFPCPRFGSDACGWMNQSAVSSITEGTTARMDRKEQQAPSKNEAARPVRGVPYPVLRDQRGRDARR